MIYLPSFEKDHWHVVDAASGDMLAKIEPKSGAHNTVYGPSGRAAYLAGLKSPLLTITDTSKHVAARTCGPFAASIRPFTVNGRETLCFVNVNELLGFEIGDLTTGKKLHRVEVAGFQKGPVKRHGCPSHGIGLTPDEKEIWVCDATNQRMHVFDATVMPPKQVASLKVRDEPGWITFSIDGKLAYPSTGDVFDVATRKIVTSLTDETGAAVASEKLLEIDWRERTDPQRRSVRGRTSSSKVDRTASQPRPRLRVQRRLPRSQPGDPWRRILRVRALVNPRPVVAFQRMR